MKLITPQSIAYTASVTEDELRKRMAYEVLDQIGGLDDHGKPLPGLKWEVRPGASRAGGYTIHISGPAPARLSLPRPE